MERIVKDTVLTYLLRNGLISNAQHGFLPKRSTTTNLLVLTDHLTNTLDKGQSTDIAFLDFAKAFNKVPHDKLLHKLRAYGIAGCTLRWIKGLLTDRKQRVVQGHHTSDWAAVGSGVIQGSVLGPLLFVIYINDITDHVEASILIYADDTKIFSTNRQLLQADLDRVFEWSVRWDLPLNLDKCEVLTIARSHPTSTAQQYTINGTAIKRSTEVKDLGLLLSSDLTWSKHINTTAAKANNTYRQIKKCFINHNDIIIGKLYKTFVRPQLEYANGVLLPATAKDAKTLDNVTYRCTKLGRQKMFPRPTRLANLHIQAPKLRRLRGDLILLYKHYNSLTCIPFQNPPISHLQYHHERSGKHSSTYTTAAAKTTMRSNFLLNRVASAWNSLPKAAVDAPSLNCFKDVIDDLFKRKKIIVNENAYK
jgi:hypothetical protein